MMPLKFCWFFLNFLCLISYLFTQQFPEPTRSIDLWNPFGITSTRRPGLVGILINFIKIY